MRRLFVILPCLIGLIVPSLHARALKPQQAESAKDRLLKVCAAERFEFTPKLRNAFLAYAKQQTAADLQAEGKSLPKDFLEWIDSDSVVEAGVYGVHHKPADVLLWLYSLRLDLGKARFEEYRQLALAAAIVSAKEGMAAADTTPREPLKLVIPGDPRRPVDTKDPNRELDVNNHIINFLNDHTIEEEVVIGHKEASHELKYDERGIAIPAPKNQKPKKVPITETRERSLYAADVIASADLQRKFNAYMKSNGQDVKIDCGECIVHWNSRDMVRGEKYKKIDRAYRMFRTAYEAKGLLPMKRDPFPSPAERCLYLIRNYEYEFPKDLQADRKWPRFPLTAPWPVLTMLAADRQPLREREERWEAFRDRGELKTYGEYIGGIAQQHAMQSARRLKPYPFTYATIQMMLKDGGVCGTMGSISARSHVTLGIPACQATQPGHCAMVAYQYDPESQAYSCKGGQYATGGDDKTGPFTPWPLADVFRRTGRKNGYEVAFHNRKPMVYHQSVAWGINYGVQSYLDSVIAYAVFRLVPEDQQQTHGLELLESGLAVNPYSFLLVDAAQNLAGTPQEQMRFWKRFQAALKSAAGKPGCPTEGLYNTTVKDKMVARIAKLPVPEDKGTALEVLAFLEEENCTIPAALAVYRPSTSLAAVKPAQQTGEVSINRNPENGPLDLGDVVYATGIGVIAGSDLTYDVSRREGRFEAWAGIDPNVSAQRSGRFCVYADGNLAFDSGVIDQAAKRGSTQNPTRPIRVVVPLAGVTKLRLTFECEDDKDKAGLCGGWGDAKFVPASAPEYRLGKYKGTTLAQTPPMGWNSWCRYGTGINEELIKNVADAMVDSGMRDAGYVYVGLDDGWQAPGAKFDDQGYPLWDTKKFPSGMKALGDYLHAKGLKFGIYSRAGWVKGHETQFAERFAEWGVDLVKYDFSNKEQQKATLDAIRAAGRDVVFSVCEWGRERSWLWAPGFNAEMWRTTYDVKDKWTSKYDNNGGIGVLRSAHQNEALGSFVGPGRWNDMDMLQIGVDGFDYGHDRKKAGFDITPDEERFQMSLWSILASPLLAANDVIAMNEHTKSILLNKQVIAVNQDPLGVPGWRVKKMDQIEVWKRPLTGGDIAVVFVNLDEKPRDIDVTWAQLNITGPRQVTDLWQQRGLGQHDKQLKFDAVPSHGVVFVRLSK